MFKFYGSLQVCHSKPNGPGTYVDDIAADKVSLLRFSYCSASRYFQDLTHIFALEECPFVTFFSIHCKIIPPRFPDFRYFPVPL